MEASTAGTGDETGRGGEAGAGAGARGAVPPDNLWVAEHVGLSLCEAMVAYREVSFVLEGGLCWLTVLYTGACAPVDDGLGGGESLRTRFGHALADERTIRRVGRQERSWSGARCVCIIGAYGMFCTWLPVSLSGFVVLLRLVDEVFVSRSLCWV